MTRDQLIHWQKRRKMGRLRYAAMTGALGFAPVAFVICQALNIGETIAGVIGITFGTTLVGMGLASVFLALMSVFFRKKFQREGFCRINLSTLPQEGDESSS